jgi:hypothetical protein
MCSIIRLRVYVQSFSCCNSFRVLTQDITLRLKLSSMKDNYVT